MNVYFIYAFRLFHLRALLLCVFIKGHRLYGNKLINYNNICVNLSTLEYIVLFTLGYYNIVNKYKYIIFDKVYNTSNIKCIQ